MLIRLYSAALIGVDALEVEVEVNNVAKNKFSLQIVGLPDATVRESCQRVLSAISNSSLKFSNGINTINLAPADLKKEGPSFDLPIALAMAAIGSESCLPSSEEFIIVGELALDGKLRPVKGVISIALEALRQGRSKLLVPLENASEASIVTGLGVFGVTSLHEAWLILNGEKVVPPHQLESDSYFDQQSEDHLINMEDVKGQHQAKRAFEIAAAGGHNILMVGPPGTGKSMIAKRMPTIMPHMQFEEAIETTKIHSIAGLLKGNEYLIRQRPYRAPHHTISNAGLLGGGTHPGPGEISLAHNGLLFLDELPEFRRQTLEVLRQPLEDGIVTIARASGSLTFPSKCLLVAAMNPCPCGFYGDLKRICKCSPPQIEKYRQRISGPLLDRIDIHVEVPFIPFDQLENNSKGEPSHQIQQRVQNARDIQNSRYEGIPIHCNAQITPKLKQTFCTLDKESTTLLKQAMQELHFSARAHDRILKVSRTIADLDQQAEIQVDHLLEAIQYRSFDRKTGL